MTPSIMELRELVKIRQKISLIELANETRCPKAMVETMMEKLVEKRQVETWVPTVQSRSCCGSGASCGCGAAQDPVRWYRWIGL